MTREEAIEAIKCNWPDSRYTILREALDMAISALRQQDVADKDVGKMTNAQKIRAMTDEELAFVMYHPFCDKRTDKECKAFGDCNQCALEWLQRPSGEEDKHETD